MSCVETSPEAGQPMRVRERIEISGSGPAGMAGALAATRAGAKATIYELRVDVGGRFHGDFQGLENWTTEVDVLDELSDLGIEPSFDHIPAHDAVFFGPTGREHVYHSDRPALYLVRRGNAPGMLDRALKDQALARGVDIRFKHKCERLPRGGVVAHGPRRPNVISVGYVFDTDSADGVFAALSDDLAPKGYAYLLIHRGHGTVASCMFDHFHEEKIFVERTVELFRRKVGFDMKAPRRFGGLGNFYWVNTARHGTILLAGEAAGFQDALWGFGLRYAMVSGSLAARAALAGAPETYDELWERRFGGLLRASAVNRFVYELMGSIGYGNLLRDLDRTSDVRAYLRRRYAMKAWKRVLAPLAHRKFRFDGGGSCTEPSCDCTWCRYPRSASEVTTGEPSVARAQ